MTSGTEMASRLREFGIQPSVQRIAVYTYLMEMRNHPTADTVFRALAPDHPTLSRTTVYNTMKVFLAHNAVQPILIEDGEMRFDADMSVHAHFKCRKCGEVFDIFMTKDQTLPPPPDGFRAEETHLYFRGLCKDCAS